MKMKLNIFYRNIFTWLVFLVTTYTAYGQAPNTWTQRANINGGGRNGAFSFGNTTKGYIGGGYTGNQLWEYDIATNTWSQKANYPGANSIWSSCFSIDNKGYVGLGGGYGTVASDFWEYDMVNNTWTAKANFPGGARGQAAHFVLNGKAYVSTGSSTFSAITGNYADLWMYDPATNTWTQRAPFPGAARQFAHGFAIGDKGYVGGGTNYDGSGTYYNNFFSYDPVSNSWSSIAALPINLYAGSTFSLGNKGYVGMGLTSSPGTLSKTQSLYAYDPLNNTWTQKANFPGVARNSAVGFTIGLRAFMGTGYGTNSNNESDFYEYMGDALITGTAPLSVCPNKSFTISYNCASPYFTTGNIFSAQLSNASGSFATPVVIGTSASTIAGNINVTIPSGTPPGSGYRIRVVASQPAQIGTDNGVNITVTAPVTSTVNASIYPGQSYTFGGNTYTTPQSGIQHTFTSSTGCDSIVTLYLTLAQLNCQLNLTASDTFACQGKQVKIKSIGALYPPNQVFDFNQNQLPPGWAISGTANFVANTCGPSMDNTPYFWASTAAGTPNIATGSIDICSGGFLEFDMRYAIQGGSTPCEGPDEQDEGVSLEYSLNGGTTWTEFLYYSPGGFELPANPGGNNSIAFGPTAYTNWNTYTVPIPAAALSSNTRFRWIQKFGSGSCCDNWGLDNIKILAGPCLGTTKVWSNGLNNVDSFTFSAVTDTCFTLRVYDNNNVLLCSDSICVRVNPPAMAVQTASVCQGQSYTFNGIQYTTSNYTAKDTLLTAQGCDSIVTLNLTVNPAYTNTINPVICQGNSYNFGGTVYTTAQTGIVHTFQTASGCDSIVTMNLTVNPPLTGTQTTTICQGQSYTFNGIVYTTSNNTAKDTLQNQYGCDSIVTLNLTVNPAYTNTINPVICQGNSYNFGGTVYTTAQTGIVHTFQTASGCDSIVTMNLAVNPPLTGTQTTTICHGQSYTFNGIAYTASNNTAKDTLQNAQGCDSIVTLNLTVTPAITHTINPVICQGNSYNFGGTVYTTSQTGIVHNFPTAQGCDSLVTMNLTVSPPLTNTINPVICQGNTYTFAGTAYTTSQTGVVHTFQTAQGCDSIVTMNLTVNPVTTGTQTTVLCQGQSFTFNGSNYTSSNYTAKDTLVNQYGCDSIVTLNLTVNPVTSGTQTVTICQGHSYTFNGITYTAGNTTATDTLVNQYGCDSIVTLNLTVTPAPATTLNDTICLGDSYTFGPHVFTTDQSGFVHNFPTAQGCDSLVTLNLTVLNIVPQPLNIQQSGCDVVSFEGTDYTSSTIINDTLYSDFGCDSIYRHIEITVHKTTAYTRRIDTVGCDEVFVNGVRYTSDAQVSDTLKNQYGCDSVYRNFHIKIYQFQLDLSFTPDDPYEMERIEFKTSSYYGNNYKVLSWSPATAFSDQDAKSQTASFTAPAQVIVRARSLDGGCEDEFRVNIDPREYSKEVAVPNAFSPNGDGLNDIFRPVLKLERAYNTMDFRIYNRYGQLVHATANMNHGWDGMYNGRPADNGVYSYKLVIYFLDGTNKVFIGEVSLVR